MSFLFQRSKLIAYVVFGLLFLAFIMVSQGPFEGDNKHRRDKTTPKRDLSSHPIYSGYKFSKADNVINIGIQPLWVPTGLITEAFKRDTVLQKELAELGKELRFYSFLKGDDVNFFLKHGQIAVGIGGDMPAIHAASTFDVIIPALIQQGFCSIVAKRHMLLKELRGEPIGYAYGSNAHYALLNALAYEGITKNDVNLISMDVTEMPESLQKGEVTAFAAWEPTPSITLNKYPDNVVIHRSQSSGYLYFSRSFSEKYPEAMRLIVAAEIRAIKWMQNDIKNLVRASFWSHKAGEDLSGKKLAFSIKENAELAQKDIIGLSSIPRISAKHLKQEGPLHKEFKFLKELGKIPVSVRWDKVRSSFNLQIIKEIIANKKIYKLNEFKYEFKTPLNLP